MVDCLGFSIGYAGIPYLVIGELFPARWFTLQYTFGCCQICQSKFLEYFHDQTICLHIIFVSDGGLSVGDFNTYVLVFTPLPHFDIGEKVGRWYINILHSQNNGFTQFHTNILCSHRNMCGSISSMFNLLNLFITLKFFTQLTTITSYQTIIWWVP